MLENSTYVNLVYPIPSFGQVCNSSSHVHYLDDLEQSTQTSDTITPPPPPSSHLGRLVDGPLGSVGKVMVGQTNAHFMSGKGPHTHTPFPTSR